MSSESIGWVLCEGVLNVQKAKHRYPPFTVTFTTEETKAPTDWRNMTLSPITYGLNDNPGDACYTEVTVAIDAEFEGVQLEVKTGNYFGSNTIIRNSIYENVIDRAGTFWSRQKFFFEVAEKTHWYAYLKLEDKVIWPRFVEVSYILPTHCEGVKYTIDSIRPTDDLNCDELVRADL